MEKCITKMTNKYGEQVSYNKTQYNNMYNNEHYDRVNLLLPKGMKQDIKKAANVLDESINAYILRAIRSQLKRGSFSDI